jgi:hypothetical protein
VGKHSKATNRPVLAKSAVLASAAALTIATPELLPTHSADASAHRISDAPYELTAFSDITVQGINDAYWFGWGGYLTNDNEYYPNILDNANNGQPIFVSGVSGVAYYLVDNVLDQFDDSIDLDNYYFEVGAMNRGVPNATYSGAGSLIYVGTGELFGTDSPLFQAVQTVFYYGITNVINSAIVTLATALVPAITIGPVTVGAGILASLYYRGYTPDGLFVANSRGLPAIWAYVSTAITGLIPTASATPTAAAAIEPTETAADTQVNVRPAIAGLKAASDPGTPHSADAPKPDLEGSAPISDATNGVASNAKDSDGSSDARAADASTATSTDTGADTKAPKHSARGRGHAKPAGIGYVSKPSSSN